MAYQVIEMRRYCVQSALAPWATGHALYTRARTMSEPEHKQNASIYTQSDLDVMSEFLMA